MSPQIEWTPVTHFAVQRRTSLQSKVGSMCPTLFLSEYIAFKLRTKLISFPRDCYDYTKSYTARKALRCGRLVIFPIAGNVLSIYLNKGRYSLCLMAKIPKLSNILTRYPQWEISRVCYSAKQR